MGYLNTNAKAVHRRGPAVGENQASLAKAIAERPSFSPHADNTTLTHAHNARLIAPPLLSSCGRWGGIAAQLQEWRKRGEESDQHRHEQGQTDERRYHQLSTILASLQPQSRPRTMHRGAVDDTMPGPRLTPVQDLCQRSDPATRQGCFQLATALISALLPRLSQGGARLHLGNTGECS